MRLDRRAFLKHVAVGTVAAATSAAWAREEVKPRAKFAPPPGRVLHGWGQQLLTYPREAAPYVAACGHEFALLSDYTDLMLTGEVSADTLAHARETQTQLASLSDEDVARLVQAYNTTPQRFAQFRKDVGKPYLPLLGVTWITATDQELAEGRHDARIEALARAVKACPFPFYLRPGFEFGPFGFSESLKMTSREHYSRMFRRFVSIFRRQRVRNVAFVWNTVGVEAWDSWMDYYPGDDVVDWWGINLFTEGQIAGAGSFLEAAKQHGKPAMICESGPTLTEGKRGTTDRANLTRFFEPYFALLRAHPHIAAFVYINLDWSAQPESPFAHWPDTRIQITAEIAEWYRQTLSDPRFLHLDDLTARPELLGA